MELRREIAEVEVVAEFLRANFASKQNSGHIIWRLHRDGRTPEVIDKPDLTSPTDNAYRAKILGEIHGYGLNTNLFTGFPAENDIKWHRAILTSEEIRGIQYLKLPAWMRLAGGTRRVADGGIAVAAGKGDREINTQMIVEIARSIEAGSQLPELILVARSEQGSPILLDGHHRLTAHFMREETIPAELPVLIGFSLKLTAWPFY